MSVLSDNKERLEKARAVDGVTDAEVAIDLLLCFATISGFRIVLDSDDRIVNLTNEDE